jgi:hypothetical protein
MTEQDWLGCAEVNALLGFVRDRASDRKRGLFAAACCRQVWILFMASLGCRYPDVTLAP